MYILDSLVAMAMEPRARPPRSGSIDRDARITCVDRYHNIRYVRCLVYIGSARLSARAQPTCMGGILVLDFLRWAQRVRHPCVQAGSKHSLHEAGLGLYIIGASRFYDHPKATPRRGYVRVTLLPSKSLSVSKQLPILVKLHRTC